MYIKNVINVAIFHDLKKNPGQTRKIINCQYSLKARIMVLKKKKKKRNCDKIVLKNQMWNI